MENSTDARPHAPAAARLSYDEVAQLLFVTASYIVADAVRAGRAPQVIDRISRLSMRLASTGFWELHYRRPAPREVRAQADEVAEAHQGEPAIIGVLAGLTKLCDEAVLRVAVEQVMVPNHWWAFAGE